MLMRAAVLPWFAFGALSLAANAAAAEPGDHIRLGSGGEFVPSLSVAGVYRTNNYLTVGSRFGDSEDDAAVGGAHLQVRPQFTIDYESRALELGVTGGYDFRKYFVEGLTNLDRFRNFNAGLSMGILPQGVVGVNLDSGVQITGRETEAVNSDDALLQQLVSRNEATLSVRPGNAMELQAGGVFEARSITVPEGFVQQPNGAPSANLNARRGYGVVSSFNWEFLPKTAIVADFERITTLWESNEISARGQGVGDFAIEASDGGFIPCDQVNGSDCFLPVPDGVFTSFHAGLRGRFTKKLVVGAVLGYTRATFDATTVEAPLLSEDGQPAGTQAMVDREDSAKCGQLGAAEGVNDELVGLPCALNGNFEVRYDIRPNHRITTGFLRDTQPVFFTNYLNLNRYYIGYLGTFADRHTMSVSFDANQQFYRGQVVRDDLWFRARTDFGWGVLKWLVIDTGVWYTGRRSADQAYPTIEYDDFNIHGGFTMTY
ncbi:MAG: hypothetical protein CL927_06235 [Deltaproteobacteria bacterium]|nr:hypothetical protein [Deltaproteobacteria bacterium]